MQLAQAQHLEGMKWYRLLTLPLSLCYYSSALLKYGFLEVKFLLFLLYSYLA